MTSISNELALLIVMATVVALWLASSAVGL